MRARLDGVPRLIVSLLYGCGLRLQECLDLPVKDLDFDGNLIVVRRGKGQKDSRTIMPSALKDLCVKHSCGQWVARSSDACAFSKADESCRPSRSPDSRLHRANIAPIQGISLADER